MKKILFISFWNIFIFRNYGIKRGLTNTKKMKEFYAILQNYIPYFFRKKRVGGNLLLVKKQG